MPRLFDLVKCRDERLRLAFYYAARDTLVAKDLDQASRIAYGADRRWRRVVTLQVGGASAGQGAPWVGQDWRGARACGWPGVLTTACVALCARLCTG